MFSLQQLFGKKDRFLELLEAAAQEAHQSVRLLLELIRTPPQKQSLDDLVLSRRKEKKIAEQIGTQLVRTFVTAIEREDIESLSHALYKIPKAVEKFAERFRIAAPQLSGISFSTQAQWMEKATNIVLEMVRQLRDLKHIEKMKELNDRLQYVEGEADKAMVELLADLYSGRHDPLRALIVKDLYELMEKVVDRCRDAGNVVLHIVLKNS